MKSFKQALLLIKETVLGIFVRDYIEDKERAIELEKFLKYDCICDANDKNDKIYHGYCREHKRNWK